MLSKQQILDHVWQYDFNGEDNVVETYVSYLRRKLDDREPRLVRTVRGFGYVLRAETPAEIEHLDMSLRSRLLLSLAVTSRSPSSSPGGSSSVLSASPGRHGSTPSCATLAVAAGPFPAP